jgi:hypothetical protein
MNIGSVLYRTSPESVFTTIPLKLVFEAHTEVRKSYSSASLAMWLNWRVVLIVPAVVGYVNRE